MLHALQKKSIWVLFLSVNWTIHSCMFTVCEWWWWTHTADGQKYSRGSRSFSPDPVLCDGGSILSSAVDEKVSSAWAQADRSLCQHDPGEDGSCASVCGRRERPWPPGHRRDISRRGCVCWGQLRCGRVRQVRSVTYLLRNLRWRLCISKMSCFRTRAFVV